MPSGLIINHTINQNIAFIFMYVCLFEPTSSTQFVSGVSPFFPFPFPFWLPFPLFKLNVKKKDEQEANEMYVRIR